MSYNDGGTRSNDGLDTSKTTDAYGDSGRGNTGFRSNDGLDASGTSDAYGSSGRGGGSNYRGNDGLDASGTSDARGGGIGGGGASRTNDGLDPSGTSDAYGDSSRGYGGGNEYKDERSAGATSGGLGFDDTIGDNTRTGGAQRGGDQETSQHTSGGLGENDTYGEEADTGGADTGYDHNYGMGTGRTRSQEDGGPLPTEAGREDINRPGDDFDPRRGEEGDDDSPVRNRVYNERGEGIGYERGEGGGYDDDSRRSEKSSNKDSTTGKLMEKAGGLFKNENLREKGEEKRRQAGGNDY